jgi:hypothetical protein
MFIVIVIGLLAVLIAQLVCIRRVNGVKNALLNEDRTLREQIAKLRLDAIRARVTKDGPV